MMIIKLINNARKIHRISVLTVTALILIMGVTGALLKYTFISENISLVDLGMVRYIHNNLSPFLSAVLMVMVVTGLIMYFSPFLLKIFSKKSAGENKV